MPNIDQDIAAQLQSKREIVDEILQLAEDLSEELIIPSEDDYQKLARNLYIKGWRKST